MTLLTGQHVTPHFSHGLKYIDFVGRTCTLTEVTSNGKVTGTYSDGKVTRESRSPVHTIKPIFRNLSMVTDTIIHNGEEWCGLATLIEGVGKDTWKHFYKPLFESKSMLELIDHLPHWFVVELEKRMFDMKWMIGRDLAVDVDTLKYNPYA